MRLSDCPPAKSKHLNNNPEVGLEKMFDVLVQYRMPSRPKDLQWLDRANSAVSAIRFNHQSWQESRYPTFAIGFLGLTESLSYRRAVSKVWAQARANYTRMYQEAGANPSDFEDLIAWLSHHDSAEYRATIKHERDKISAKIADRSIHKQLTDDS